MKFTVHKLNPKVWSLGLEVYYWPWYEWPDLSEIHCMELGFNLRFLRWHVEISHKLK